MSGDKAFDELRERIWVASNGAVELLLAVIEPPSTKCYTHAPTHYAEPAIAPSTVSQVFKNVWALFPSVCLVKLHYWDKVIRPSDARRVSRDDKDRNFIVCTLTCGEVLLTWEQSINPKMAVSVIPQQQLPHMSHPEEVFQLLQWYEHVVFSGPLDCRRSAQRFSMSLRGFDAPPLCAANACHRVDIGGPLFRSVNHDLPLACGAGLEGASITFCVPASEDEEVIVANKLLLHVDAEQRCSDPGLPVDFRYRMAIEQLAILQDWIPVMHQFGGDTTRVYLGLDDHNLYSVNRFQHMAPVIDAGVWSKATKNAVMAPTEFWKQRAERRGLTFPVRYSLTLRQPSTSISQVDLMALYGNTDPLTAARQVFSLIDPLTINWRRLNEITEPKVKYSEILGDNMTRCSFQVAVREKMPHLADGWEMSLKGVDFRSYIVPIETAKRPHPLIYSGITTVPLSVEGRSPLDQINMLVVPRPYYISHAFASGQGDMIESIVRGASPLPKDIDGLVMEYYGHVATLTETACAAMKQRKREHMLEVAKGEFWQLTDHSRSEMLAESSLLVNLGRRQSYRKENGAPPTGRHTLQWERFECLAFFKDVYQSLALKRMTRKTGRLWEAVPEEGWEGQGVHVDLSGLNDSDMEDE